MVVEAAILVDDEHQRRIRGLARRRIVAAIAPAGPRFPFDVPDAQPRIVGGDLRLAGRAGDAGEEQSGRGAAAGDAAELGHEGPAVHAFMGEAVVEPDGLGKLVRCHAGCGALCGCGIAASSSSRARTAAGRACSRSEYSVKAGRLSIVPNIMPQPIWAPT